MIAKRLEFKFSPASDAGRFIGTASAFGVVDRHGDIVVKGACAKTLDAWERRPARLPLLWQHMGDDQIGHVTRAEETDSGLEIEGQIVPGTPSADRAIRLLEAGGMGLSIGFTLPPGGARLRADGIREIVEIDLAEISAVSVPSNPETYAELVRSSPRYLERLARDVLGLTQREAKRLTHGGYAELVRDVQTDATQDHDAARLNAALAKIILS